MGFNPSMKNQNGCGCSSKGNSWSSSSDNMQIPAIMNRWTHSILNAESSGIDSPINSSGLTRINNPESKNIRPIGVPYIGQDGHIRIPISYYLAPNGI